MARKGAVSCKVLQTGSDPVAKGICEERMGEPLSVAASAAGIVSLGLQVCQSIVSFYQSYTDQERDVSRTLTSILGLLKVLESLDATLKERRFTPEEEHTRRNLEESISACTESIEELRTELEKFQSRAGTGRPGTEVMRRGLRKVSCPFKESTLMKLRETVQDMRDNIGLALECLGLKTATAQIRDIQEVSSKLSSMHQGLPFPSRSYSTRKLIIFSASRRSPN